MVRKGWVYGLLLAMFASLAPSDAFAATGNGSLNTRWKLLPIINLVVTPNYAPGYGAIKANLGGGAAPPPTTGPGAPTAVDFGNVMQGATYLYRYAAKVSITGNSNFLLYGEGSADLTGTSGAASGSTVPINQTLFWLPSNDGSVSDPNTGYSPSNAFSRTTQPGASYNNPNITYGAYPTPITSGSGAQNYYYDYQMRVGSSYTLGTYNVYVVYTAVAQ